ncbi:MAG: NAD+ synthase [Geminicoccaceae bacterium]|nr:NAD+ synthase [Geminicoccaceae bacterium]
MSEITIATAQINPTVGDLDGNVRLIGETYRQAAEQGADLVIFSEMVVTGYPLEDLVLKPALLRAAAKALEQLAGLTGNGNPAMIVGSPVAMPHSTRPTNNAVLLAEGLIRASHAKHALPNYGVFDELRVFAQGPMPGPMPLTLRDGSRIRLGVMVCEDMWIEDVAEALEESGAEILVVINGSPFETSKQDVRIQKALNRVVETGLPLVYVNQVGGQDELVFDGASFALGHDRRLVAQAPWFEPALQLTRWSNDGGQWVGTANGPQAEPPSEIESIYRAMVLGLRDYVAKNRFPGVVLGLSGGVDSALSAAVAVDALGADKVHAVMMPSRYTSKESLEDATGCARYLDIRLDEIAIEPAVDAFSGMLASVFENRAADTTEENIQSRIRGVILMGISNKLGSMLLTTGNKSEMSVGYATLYGDMCGGYSVLKDVYKMTVFELCRYRNRHRPHGCFGPQGPVMPQRVIDKPPSAELRADQKDEDSLPPYEVLDAILQGLVEDDLSPAELVEKGFAPERVIQVSNLLDLAEYKRRQAPPGVKITQKAFGRDRRYPITNHFRRMGLKAAEPT